LDIAENENFKYMLDMLKNRKGIKELCNIKPDFMSRKSVKLIAIFVMVILGRDFIEGTFLTITFLIGVYFS
jgi:hypothetical protein